MSNEVLMKIEGQTSSSDIWSDVFSQSNARIMHLRTKMNQT
jgi:hypothetical protein